MAIVTSMGVDPGLASMGVAVVRYDPDKPDDLPKVVEAFTVKTTKSKLKTQRIAQDDVHRMNMLWLSIKQTIDEFKPDVIGVEAYTVYKKGQGGHRGNGVGWKAIYAYAMTCAMGFEHDVTVYPFQPKDLHIRVGNPSAPSKIGVERGVRARTAGLQDMLDGIPAGQHEHACDACGHALMALADYVHSRK